MTVNICLVNGMTYWSTDKIPAINIQPSYLDTNVRIMPKKGSSVGAYTVTATSYALMAYLESGQPEDDLDSIQKFLQEQHLSVGGFYSSHVCTCNVYSPVAALF